ncbi:MAG TPA: phospholipase, partial [Solirubrobacteraceae bacterium]
MSLDGLVHRVRSARGEPEGALVLMHGRGADENDLFGFLDILDPERRLVGVTPGGPLFLPPGGRHWYIVPRVGFPDPETFAASFGLLEGFLDGVADETGVPPERTVLGGFSQGTVMAYALGLGRGRPTPAGIVALSGFVPTVTGWAADLDRQGLPVWIAHGRRDPVIPVDLARSARER